MTDVTELVSLRIRLDKKMVRELNRIADEEHVDRIRYLESYQTLLQPPIVPEIEEEPEKGLDKGGFVVIVGVKN